MKLFIVTLQEWDNPRCTRDHYVLAKGFSQAATKALRQNVANLWKPSVVGVKSLGRPIS